MKKKLILSLAAAIMSSFMMSVNAQTLKDILKNTKASDVVNAVTSVVGAATNTVSLPGTWSYTGPAIALSSDKVVSNIAGSALTSGLEKKVETTFEKFGIKPGTVKFVFSEGMSFTCTIAGKSLSGTWKQNTEDSRLTLQFGQTMKYLSITGDLKASLSGCELLFDADRFLAFLKTIMSVAGSKSTTLSAISGLSDSYEGMQLGFKLSKE